MNKRGCKVKLLIHKKLYMSKKTRRDEQIFSHLIERYFNFLVLYSIFQCKNVELFMGILL